MSVAGSGAGVRFVGSSAGRWLVLGFAALILVLACGASSAGAHAGHRHDGRLPNQPDLKQIGGATYRFDSVDDEYEIRRPGKPTAYAHVDYRSEEGFHAGPNTKLPTQELAPVCRTSGNRIVIVYTHRSSDTTPTPTETLRSIVRRMNWKINQQGSIASGGGRTVKMAVDCTSGGAINVYDVTTANNNLSTVSTAIKNQLFGEPTGTDAVRYLAFDHEENASATGISGRYKDVSKSFTNQNAALTNFSIAYSSIWEYHVPMHELFHALGSSQGDATSPPPYASKGAHCTDGIDVLCYNDGTTSDHGSFNETRCPASSGYDQPEKTPLDCGYDTYFNTAPEAGTWLDKYWNSGGEEDPFLVNESDPLLKVGGESTAEIRDAQVTLRGTVYSRSSLETSYRFEYGTTTSYGSKAPAPSTAVAATPAGKSVEVTASGLLANTTYHYRLVASNANGTLYGQDKTFKTSLWRINATPSTSEHRSFRDVSCTSREACTAVGTAGQGALAQRWDGSEWSNQAVPAVPGHEVSELRSVSCGGPSSCLAVGLSKVEQYAPASVRADVWNGSAWSSTSVPSPVDANGGAELSGVSCSGPSTCVTVGEYVAGVESEEPEGGGEEEGGEEEGEEEGGGEEPEPEEVNETRALIAAWDGSSWTLLPSPRPEGVIGYGLRGVTCLSANSCVAVGWIELTGWIRKALIERWDGTAWSLETIPALANSTWLEDVSCGSASSCLAVGTRSAVSLSSLALRWSGSAWSENSPSAGQLNSVSCPAAGTCVAVGGYTTTALDWGAGSWSSSPMSVPGGSLASSSGVSCPSTESCVAVSGSFEGGKWVALAEHRNPLVAPSASTEAASALGLAGATLNANVNPNGYATTYQFEYGTTTSYGSKAPASPQAIGSGVSAVAANEAITGLKPGTTYHYRVVASNPAGITTGSDATFTTQLNAPAVKTETATEIGRFGARLRGTVNPEGVEAKYQFEYGTTTSYGQTAPAVAKSAGSGFADVAVSETLTLEAGTTYHYRVVATGAGGTTNGADVEFTTASIPVPKLNLTIGGKGSANGQLDAQRDIEFDSSGNLWVADTNNHRIQKFNSSGEYVSKFGTFGWEAGQLAWPSGLGFNAAGELWVAQPSGSRIYRFNQKGEYQGSLGSGQGSTAGKLSGPSDVYVDIGTGVWAVDSGNNRLQKFNAKGEFLGQLGGYGKGNGQFSSTRDMDFDVWGNLWVVDQWNHRIQKYNNKGEYAGQFGSVGSGNGQFEYPEAVAVDPEGQIFVADTGNDRVQWFNQAGEYVGQIGSTGSGPGQLKEPVGLAFDPQGDLWISDRGNNRIQEWKFVGEAAGATVSTEAASNVAAKSATLHGTVNPNGFDTRFYFEYGTTTGYGSKAPVSPKAIGAGEAGVPVEAHLAGLAPATEYHFRVVAVGPGGTISGVDQQFTTTKQAPSVSASAASSVRAVGATLNATINPNGYATTYQFEYGTTTSYGSEAPASPQSIGSEADDVEVDEELTGLSPATTYHFRVVATNSIGTTKSPDQEFTTRATDAPVYDSRIHGEEGEDVRFLYETGIATDTEGNVFVVDTNGGRIQKYSPAGEHLLEVGAPGSGPGQLNSPAGVAVGPEGNIWVTDPGNGRVQEFGPEGEFVRELYPGNFAGASGIATDSGGNVFVVDSFNGRVLVFSPFGYFLRAIGSKGSGNGQLSGPIGVAIDGEDNVWVADSGNNRVQRFSWSGTHMSKFGSVGEGDGEFTGLTGIAIDPAGRIWAADQYSCRVQQFDPAGEYLQQFGECGNEPGQLGEMLEGPGLAVGPEGEIWVAVGLRHEVQRWIP